MVSSARSICLALCVSSALAWIGCGTAPSGANRPDIVLVSIDSLRADHLGCYGYERETSPFLDRLASEGVRFASAVSTTSWTLPAHAALFTGLYDSAHGVVDHGHRLADAHVTLAESLRDAGYNTAGFYGGPYLHPIFGLDQGFDVYRSCMAAIDGATDEREVLRQSAIRDSISHAEITGPRTLERFDEWLEGAGDRPLFAFIHLWDVHYDYIPPREYVERFDPDYTGELDARDFPNNRAIHRGMDPRDLRHLIALYDGEIRFTDDVLAQMVERLAGHGRDDVILVVTADHGEEFFDHGDKGHHRTLYDEVLRVPLVFHAPGRLDAGRVVEDQVRLIDVMPTLLSLAGLPPAVEIQGRDLTPLLRGESLPPVPALGELLSLGMGFRSLRTNRVKVIVDDVSGLDVEFDLWNDPGEIRPREGLTPESTELRTELRDTVERSLDLHARTVGPSTPRSEMSAEMRERLRALGYLDDEEGP